MRRMFRECVKMDGVEEVKDGELRGMNKVFVQ